MNDKFLNEDYAEGYKDAITGFLNMPKYGFGIEIMPYHFDGFVEIRIRHNGFIRSLNIDYEILHQAPILDIVDFCFMKNIMDLTKAEWEDRFKIANSGDKINS